VSIYQLAERVRNLTGKRSEIKLIPYSEAFSAGFDLKDADGRARDGLPLGERIAGLKSGLAVVELASGRLAALLEFSSGIHETFDVQVLPGIRNPAICGPFSTQDGRQPAWIVPQSWIPG